MVPHQPIKNKLARFTLLTLVLALVTVTSRASATEFDDGEEDDVGEEERSEHVMDPRLLLILPSGAGNLLNVNTTGALLALLGAASLLTALGFLIYYVVSTKLMALKGQSSYGGYSSGGYGGGSSGGYGGSSFGGAGLGAYGAGAGGGSYGYARYSIYRRT